MRRLFLGSRQPASHLEGPKALPLKGGGPMEEPQEAGAVDNEETKEVFWGDRRLGEEFATLIADAVGLHAPAQQG